MREAALFDRRFVEAAEAGVADVDDLVVSVFGNMPLCTSGWRGIEIEWLPVGTRFSVEEIEGSESLRLIEDLTNIA